jgi:hypothetical protein
MRTTGLMDYGIIGLLNFADAVARPQSINPLIHQSTNWRIHPANET